MNNNLKKQIESVDWENLGEADLPKWLWAYAGDDRQEHLYAYQYFESRLESKFALPEDYEPLSEILAKEGLVFAVPILVSLLSDPAIQSKRKILDNLNEIASNVHWELPNTVEPYRSRANRILDSLKVDIPIYEKLLHDNDEDIRKIAQELLNTLASE